MSRERDFHPQPVIITLIIALMLAIAPMPDWAEPFRPDWVTMTLIYWSMNLPRYYSIGWAWIIGLILDVAQGTLLGQHALALSLVIYVTVTFHLQMRQFPTLQLSLTVCALLALYQFILFWINGVAGVNTAAITYWGPVISGSLLWPLMTMLFGGARYRART
ncbi:MAG: rod shape-determining protein MreD [Woeseiaceae bacterium]|nr:rod shape-determining protein MreD [Woeseiaceae bacterium]